jgi:hypothetical protein
VLTRGRRPAQPPQRGPPVRPRRRRRQGYHAMMVMAPGTTSMPISATASRWCRPISSASTARSSAARQGGGPGRPAAPDVAPPPGRRLPPPRPRRRPGAPAGPHEGDREQLGHPTTPASSSSGSARRTRTARPSARSWWPAPSPAWPPHRPPAPLATSLPTPSSATSATRYWPTSATSTGTACHGHSLPDRRRSGFVVL